MLDRTGVSELPATGKRPTKRQTEIRVGEQTILVGDCAPILARMRRRIGRRGRHLAALQYRAALQIL